MHSSATVGIDRVDNLGGGGRGLACRDRGTGRGCVRLRWMWVVNLSAVQLLLLGLLVLGLRSGGHLGMLRQLCLSYAIGGDPGIGDTSEHGLELEELEQCVDQPESTHQTGTDLGAIQCYGVLLFSIRVG